MQLTDQQKQQIGPLITTEHFTLQTARSATISDANGRSSLFLSTVSSSLVALAFTGQIDTSMSLFFLFALVLFPALIFLGIVTFARVLQSAIEDTIYARAINRLRHLYVEMAPQLADYFLLSTNDDAASTLRNAGITPGRWQMFLTTAGMIGVINSVLIGAFAGLVAGFRGLPTTLWLVAGVAVFAISMLLHLRYQWRRWSQVEARLPVMFPGSSQQNEHAV